MEPVTLMLRGDMQNIFFFLNLCGQVGDKGEYSDMRKGVTCHLFSKSERFKALNARRQIVPAAEGVDATVDIEVGASVVHGAELEVDRATIAEHVGGSNRLRQ